MIRKLQAIIFDYDGVISDSVNIKGKAFEKLYEPHGQTIVRKVRYHHITHGGISRYDKFKIYHKEFLGIELDQIEIDELANRFHDMVVQKVANAPFIKGAVEFIMDHYQKIPLFIISATPIDEMNEIINKNGLNKYFKEVFGSPNSKTYWANKIIKDNEYSPDKVIFVGDAISDYQAARDCGLDFVAKVDGKNNTLFHRKNIKYKINNLFELYEHVSDIDSKTNLVKL